MGQCWGLQDVTKEDKTVSGNARTPQGNIEQLWGTLRGHRTALGDSGTQDSFGDPMT